MSVFPSRISPTTRGTSSTTICSLVRLGRHFWELSVDPLEISHDVRHDQFDALLPDARGEALLENVLDFLTDLSFTTSGTSTSTVCAAAPCAQECALRKCLRFPHGRPSRCAKLAPQLSAPRCEVRDLPKRCPSPS